MAAERLLLGGTEVQRALGSNGRVDVSREPGSIQSLGNLVSAAAADSAYRSFSGYIVAESGSKPVTVAQMALAFGTGSTAEAVFDHIAQAAHLRIRMGESNVAVETVTAASGLVSYWGFLQRGCAIVVLTLDTLDPQDVSMSHFRDLVTAASCRLCQR
ncbi:MAG: hypothetical protein NVSMB52_05270 [Chloroflexota bacterium]